MVNRKEVSGFFILHSPLKKILEGRKSADRSRWLNSPNVYQKVEVLETGTSDPKKITKVDPPKK